MYVSKAIEIDKTTAKNIWHPVLDFEDVIKAEKKRIYGLDDQSTFWHNQYLDYNMFYFELLQVTFSCQFDLADFPFDSHECNFKFGDFLMTSSAIKLTSATIYFGKTKSSLGDPPIILDNYSLPYNFELYALPAIEIFKDQAYSYTGMKIVMKRKDLGHLLAGYYYPTASFALVSMISFLIHPDAVST